jgi:hypothetical protein
MTTIEAMKMALEVLEYEYRHCNRYYPELCRAIEALEHVIPQEERKPVPVKTYSGGKAWPVQTEWVWLTDDESLHIFDTYVGEPSEKHPLKQSDWLNFSQGIEAKLKEKNSKG